MIIIIRWKVERKNGKFMGNTIVQIGWILNIFVPFAFAPVNEQVEKVFRKRKMKLFSVVSSSSSDNRIMMIIEWNHHSIKAKQKVLIRSNFLFNEKNKTKKPKTLKRLIITVQYSRILQNKDSK